MQTGINNRKSNVAVMWVAIGKDAFVFLNGSDGFDDIVDLWVRRAFRHSEEV